MKNDPGAMRTQNTGLPLCAVIVLYRRSLSETVSFQTLQRALRHANLGAADFRLLVWDNSPEPQIMPAWHHAISYHHDSSNGGLVPAYNRAIEEGLAAGGEWLLLLDQDTQMPEDYFSTFFEALSWTTLRTVSFVPRVRAGGKMVNPVGVVAGIVGLRPLDERFQGIRDEETLGINSAAFVRMSFLKELGGYSSRYRLDAVDLWFFAAAYARGRNVYVLPAWIDHDLSIANIKGIKIERWRSIMRAEREYYAHMRSRSAQLLMSALATTRAASLLLSHHLPRHMLVSLAEAGRLALGALLRKRENEENTSSSP